MKKKYCFYFFTAGSSGANASLSYPSYSFYSQYNDEDDDDIPSDLIDEIPNCPSESSAMETDLEFPEEFVPRAPEPSGPFGLMKKRFKTRFWSSGEPIGKKKHALKKYD